MTHELLLFVVALPLAACVPPPVETPRTLVVAEKTFLVEKTLDQQVDILFVVDNSRSMRPKQEALRQRFPAMIEELNRLRDDGRPAHYHLGVITTDLGANDYTDPRQSCVPGGGPRGGGRLQALGKAADPRCAPPTDGRPFLDVDQVRGASNLPSPPDGEDPLAWAFGCAAAVGDDGCGFEQPLEAARRALDGSVDNQGFLRPEALLVVVFVTDEDDCSAPPDSDIFSAQPNSAPPAGLGLQTSYRCSSFGLVCDGALLPYGATESPLLDCRPATAKDGGKLYDLERYRSFFTTPGVLKEDPPEQIILAAIAADPSLGVETMLGIPDTADSMGQPLPCAGPPGPGCSYMLKRVCASPSDVRFSGDPALRMWSLVNSIKNHQFTSICDTDYSAALQSLASLIGSSLGPRCLNVPIAHPERPDCFVAETSPSGIQTVPACADQGATPCWQLETVGSCVSLVIDRGGAAPPPGSSVRAACATLAGAGN